MFPIRLPPLRERSDDVPALIDHFLTLFSARHRRRSPAARLDGATKTRLQGEAWRGNVRELRNVLERAMILADGALIKPEHLWIDTSSAPVSASLVESSSDGSLAELERQTIDRTLAALGGNRRQAAAKLGIGLRTLYDKMKRYDLR